MKRKTAIAIAISLALATGMAALLLATPPECTPTAGNDCSVPLTDKPASGPALDPTDD